MDRREKIRFIRENIFPQIDFRNPTHLKDIMADSVRLIERWRIGKPIDIKMTAMVDDGFLYMNGEPLGRIAAKMPKIEVSEWGYYLEGRCIRDYDD